MLYLKYFLSHFLIAFQSSINRATQLKNNMKFKYLTIIYILYTDLWREELVTPLYKNTKHYLHSSSYLKTDGPRYSYSNFVIKSQPTVDIQIIKLTST